MTDAPMVRFENVTKPWVARHGRASARPEKAQPPGARRLRMVLQPKGGLLRCELHHKGARLAGVEGAGACRAVEHAGAQQRAIVLVRGRLLELEARPRHHVQLTLGAAIAIGYRQRHDALVSPRRVVTAL